MDGEPPVSVEHNPFKRVGLNEIYSFVFISLPHSAKNYVEPLLWYFGQNNFKLELLYTNCVSVWRSLSLPNCHCSQKTNSSQNNLNNEDCTIYTRFSLKKTSVVKFTLQTIPIHANLICTASSYTQLPPRSLEFHIWASKKAWSFLSTFLEVESSTDLKSVIFNKQKH